MPRSEELRVGIVKKILSPQLGGNNADSFFHSEAEKLQARACLHVTLLPF